MEDNNSIFERCFEKYSFDELNNEDFPMLNYAFQMFLNTYKFDNHKPVIFDIGSNCGSFIKVLKGYNISENIHCFEPHPKLSDMCVEKYPYIKMNKLCISNQNNHIDIYIPLWSSLLSSIIKRPIFDKLKDGGQEIIKINVPSLTIDKYCENNNIDIIDFIKIDVEGAEKMVFEGAIEMLSKKAIRCGVFEVGKETYKDANTSETEVCAILEKFGYKLYKKLPRNYVFYI
jgi:FkbM family methyltransferase